MYVDADRVIGVYGMGLTQHIHGFQNVAMLLNMLLLKGNIGRDGTGISPVRGHSNVQGQRTVGLRRRRKACRSTVTPHNLASNHRATTA